MKILLVLMLAIGGGLMATETMATGADTAEQACAPALDFEMRRLASDEAVRLCDEYQGKVVLMVNTASKCGFTGQYEGLEALYDKYGERGLVVLGFPSNDFANQEPGSEEKIQEFCRLTYSVEFPMFEKSHVKKGKASPLFQYLAEQTGVYPKWNFYKYLINREGQVVQVFSSMTNPKSGKMVKVIESLL
ncbi:glutathione peroxidase [Thiorhodovibrio frisius]|uniref:Glutathione peroxidase n=1 Tax=Thiorhodovibrio frisius TaxID=631362 RepID=H8Z569_9GAMM|nr:glutathione peroxidase [Thiorhodovibrio frisius]WPL21217.1 Glutathione peroxidase BsaA [Thiorhodovibrio frisius]